MTIFDLLFAMVVLATAAALTAAIAGAVRGRLDRAVNLLAPVGVGLALYLGAVVAVSLVSAPRVLALGENRCFDDWCIALTDAVRVGSPANVGWRVTVRVSSRARRVTQRESGVVVYVMDEAGRRFQPAADFSAAPIDTVLGPGQAVETIRTFDVSGAVGRAVLVVGRDGWDRLPGMFIIGDDASLFHKPTIVRLP